MTNYVNYVNENNLTLSGSWNFRWMKNRLYKKRTLDTIQRYGFEWVNLNRSLPIPSYDISSYLKSKVRYIWQIFLWRKYFLYLIVQYCQFFYEQTAEFLSSWQCLQWDLRQQSFQYVCWLGWYFIQYNIARWSVSVSVHWIDYVYMWKYWSTD